MANWVYSCKMQRDKQGQAVMLCTTSMVNCLIDGRSMSRMYHLACEKHNMGQSLAASQPLLPPQTMHSETGFHPNSPPSMCQAGPCSKQACRHRALLVPKMQAHDIRLRLHQYCFGHTGTCIGCVSNNELHKHAKTKVVIMCWTSSCELGVSQSVQTSTRIAMSAADVGH